MTSHGTALQVTPSIEREFHSAVIAQLPDLTDEEMQRYNRNKGELGRLLCEALASLCKPAQGQRAEEPAASALPTEFTISGRTYELVPFLKEGESSVSGDVMVGRAKELNANLGQEDCTFILDHQAEIPQELRGKVCLVFTAWRDPSVPQGVAYLSWGGTRRYQYWSWRGGWHGAGRLVRRVK